MKPNVKVTLRDIAGRLKVSHATVSRALRNDERISASMRKKVRQMASEMGYRRDPRLAELMTHLRLNQRMTYQGTIAWITNLDPADPDMAAIIEGFLPHAEARAGELGYRLDVTYRVKPLDAPRLGRTMQARGIQGIWASNFFEADYDNWKWDWRKFAFIHHGAEPKRRFVDVVDAEDRQNIQLLFESLTARGYRRIGIATTRFLESEALFELTAGSARYAQQNPAHEAIEPCLVEELNDTGARQIAKWIKRHRVDCVISRWRGMATLLAQIGYIVPNDIGLAYVTVRPHGGTALNASGIDVNSPVIARTAVETLVSAVEHRRFGLPEVARQTLVPGRWHQGTTCRDLPTSGPL